jgi:hypothetical protein
MKVCEAGCGLRASRQIADTQIAFASDGLSCALASVMAKALDCLSRSARFHDRVGADDGVARANVGDGRSR